MCPRLIQFGFLEHAISRLISSLGRRLERNNKLKTPISRRSDPNPPKNPGIISNRLPCPACSSDSNHPCDPSGCDLPRGRKEGDDEMRKRERENPCGICGHYHKYEEGEVCGVCGHRWKPSDGEGTPAGHESAFPTEVLKDFLFLGSYDNASRSEVLKTLSVSHILNTVPDCHNLYKTLFTYHTLQRDRPLDFDEANQFLEECERDKSRVLVHCMTGKNRSAAIVAAFLMKSKGWRLAQSFQWVKDRRPQVKLTNASQHELQEYEQKLFGSSAEPLIPTESFASLGFGYPKPEGGVQAPMFNPMTAPSIFERISPSDIPANFTFGAGTAGVNPQVNNNNGGASTDNPMDST